MEHTADNHFLFELLNICFDRFLEGHLHGPLDITLYYCDPSGTLRNYDPKDDYASLLRTCYQRMETEILYVREHAAEEKEETRKRMEAGAVGLAQGRKIMEEEARKAGIPELFTKAGG